MEIQVEQERTQLLDHWEKAIRKNPNWVMNELTQVTAILEASKGDENNQRSIRSYLRQFHDKLGFKAKDSRDAGGLCAGAIFRTRKFIGTAQRSGAKGADKTAHIEHTVPINNLCTAIINSRFSDYRELLAWLLKHSVTTAFHESETKFLDKRHHHTDALNLASVEYQKPFMRYDKLFKDGEAVWNVLHGTKIDQSTFTFQEHFDIVIELLERAGAAKPMLDEIRSLG
jgi:hypothetical protein